jgi:hypothetical protein
VQALALTRSGQVLIGGAFTTCSGTPRRRIARLHNDGRLDLSFDPGPGPNSNVLAVAVQPDGRVWIGGAFTSAAGVPRGYLARLNADGSVDSGPDLGSGPNGPVQWLAWRPDGRLFVGGAFSEVNGFSRNGVALLNAEPRLVGPAWRQGQFELHLPTVIGRSYILECKATLDQPSWTPLQTQPGDGTVLIFNDPNPASLQRFYRVRVE